jgi:anaerobic ribonucleoside-triphosphate reductase
MGESTMNKPKSLSTALRERAEFLNSRQSNSYLEYGWGDKNSVIAALYEFADVVDSWSGEYLSKEETYEENQRRRWGRQPVQQSMTMEERIQAVKNKQLF